ncbi:ABC transporter substrate-binding protein [Paenibacillus lentus]|uniref:ABC transporter substrate-binding protein n=1 Tax=Paenibacillus lentus TaxID=1338368 RepID=UPI00364DEFBD
MNDQSKLAPPLHSLLFYMSNIERITQPVGWKSDTHASNGHTLLVILNGSGRMHVKDNELFFAAAKCYLLSPGQHYQIANGYDSGICFYRIGFSVIRVGNHLHETYTRNFIPNRIELTIYPSARLIRMAEELFAGSHDPGELETCKQQLRFHEFVNLLIEHNYHSELPSHSTQAVERTIQYMENHYMDHITVKQLAESACVPYWQYTPIFKELTGKRPLEYLTELRINRSKHLLIHTDEPLREIARQVGFIDEYYFNRRFRQTTGIAPKQFARYMRKNKRVKDWTGHYVDIPPRPERIVYYGETLGDLLVLGIAPVGGTLPSYFGAFQEQLQRVEDIGHPVNAEILAELRPDLIILASSDERQYNQISKIAPTVTFNSFAPLEQRLQTLGDMLDRKVEAERWLKEYNSKSMRTWNKVRSSICSEETASVLVYEHGRRLFVMGSAGLSPGLYHPNGFLPVAEVQKLLHEGQGHVEIKEADLPAYAGDRIFMMQPEREESRIAMEELMGSRLWHSLPAVRNGRVHLLEAAKWNCGDAITQELLIESLPHLLNKTYR